MNSDDPEWEILQAGEYVLGTLDDESVREINERLQHDTTLQRLVLEWEERLQPLAYSVKPVTPPREVWLWLSDQLGQRVSAFVEPPKRYPTVSEFDPNRRSKRRQTRSKLVAWQWIGSLAMAACAVLAVALWQVQREPGTETFDVVSVVSSEDVGALWVVNASLESKRLRITAIAPPEINEDQDHQLWMVLPNDAGVQSLGILPKSSSTTVTVDVPAMANDAVALAVSLEPAGGSPEAVPTGPVLYQGAFLKVRNESR